MAFVAEAVSQIAFSMPEEALATRDSRSKNFEHEA
jgi:hypothetical protein